MLGAGEYNDKKATFFPYKSYELVQGLTNFFCRGPYNTITGFGGAIQSLLPTTQLSCKAKIVIDNR